MFFKRTQGDYRETDRVTRFKLVKSGKSWLRAATSSLGLFKVVRGKSEEAVVATIRDEQEVKSGISGLGLLKGLASAGVVLGGAAAVTTAQAEENETTTAALTSEVGTISTLPTTDSVNLGTTNASQSVATSEQTSDTTSESLSDTTLASQEISLSESASFSE